MNKHFLKAGIIGVLLAFLNLVMILVAGRNATFLAIAFAPGFLIGELLDLGRWVATLLGFVAGSAIYGGIALFILRRIEKKSQESRSLFNLK